MRRIRYVPKRQYEAVTEPFQTTEEAWFWYVRCQTVRWQGARLTDGPVDVMRPCDPDDIYRAVKHLYRLGVIGAGHLRVLGVFGLRECPPDARSRDEERAAGLWDEALDRLSTILRRKGIVV